jgi:hypothetical protein
MKPWAMSLALIVYSGFTAGHIYLVGHGFQVGRIDAATHAAEMIDHEPFGYRAVIFFIHEAMDIFRGG